MEGICSLRGQVLTSVPTSSPSLRRRGFRFHGRRCNASHHLVRFSSLRNRPESGKLGFLDLKIRSSVPLTASSEAMEANPNSSDSKDRDVVFVAGATGKVGSRTVRELLKLGFRVRAGVRTAQKGKSLAQSVEETDLKNKNETATRFPAVGKLEIVECDLEKKDSIGPALGNASVVICCIGASEKEILDITGPYRIDFKATKNLVDAAKAAKVDHFLLVTSLGTNKFGFPAAILNLFWGVLCWKRKAEEALIASGVPYTIVRPGGMERPTDAYKETHNLTLSVEDTLFGGQVSNLQVAELLAFMAKNPRLSYCKIVEAIAETTSPLTPMEDLLERVPSKRPYIPPTTTEQAAAKEPEPTAPVGEDSPPEKKPRPLSPYAAYDDLKPPTSPIPSSTSESLGETSVEESTKRVSETKARPLSPYACYADLKPPTSPIPTASGTSASAENVSESLGGNDVAKTAIAINDTEQLPRSNSPFGAYEDLRPPSSPSPTSATPSSPPKHDVPETSNQDQTSPKPRPLSPYAMYEDLKPPTSPIPSKSTNH